MTSTEQSRERRAYLKIVKRCQRCGRQDARTLIGKPMCFDCLERKNEYERRRYPDYADKKRERQKNLRLERKEAGLCPRCGAPLPEQSTRISCKACRKKACKREELKRRAADIRSVAELAENDLCVTCGKPVKQGYNSGGQPIRLCESCYEKSLRSMALARQVRKENGPNYFEEQQRLFYGICKQFEESRPRA